MKRKTIKGKRTNYTKSAYLSKETKEHDQHEFLRKCKKFISMNPSNSDRTKLDKVLRNVEKHAATPEIRAKTIDIRERNAKRLKS